MHRLRVLKNAGRAFGMALCLAFGTVLPAATFADTLPLPPNLIGLDSRQGEDLLLDRATVREAYWPLSLQFVTQKNQAFCGVATMVMVLNALNVAAPVTPDTQPFAAFSQDNVLNDDTERILPRELLMKQGMTLDQAGQLLASHGVAVDTRHAADDSVDNFRTAAVAALGERERHVVVNYLRMALGQERGGHISPLAAYDAASDRFLILDVSRYKYPPVWARADELFAAMNTPDASNGGRSRGYLLIRKGP